MNDNLGAPSHLIGGKRGSHILLRHDALVAALDGQMIYFESDDGQICLVFAHLGLALAGSTDISAANPETVSVEEAEITYLLDSLQGLLPDLRIQRD